MASKRHFAFKFYIKAQRFKLIHPEFYNPLPPCGDMFEAGLGVLSTTRA